MEFLHFFSVLHPLILTVEPIIKQSQDAGRAIALGVGAGGGAAGAGAGIGAVSTPRSRPRPASPSCAPRSSAISGSASRSPRRVFYGLVGGFIAFFL